MAVTQPTLGGSALPWPQQDGGYRIRKEYRGGVAVMADGSVNFDLVVTGTKRIVSLAWVNISETDRDTIDTRLAALGTGSATLKTPEWQSAADDITVTLDENMSLPEWTAIGVPDGSGGQNLRYSGSVTLREV